MPSYIVALATRIGFWACLGRDIISILSSNSVVYVYRDQRGILLLIIPTARLFFVFFLWFTVIYIYIYINAVTVVMTTPNKYPYDSNNEISMTM